MCPSDTVANIANRKVEGIEFVVPSAHGYGGLVAPENQGYESAPVGIGIF